MKKTNILYIILFSLFLIYSVINIQETKQHTSNSIIVFSKSILPSLLPFLILNQLIIKLGIIDLLGYVFQYISCPLFKISGKGASTIIIGLLNGFPSSVIFTSLMLKDKQLEKQEAQRIINAIFFPSISFLFLIINHNINNTKLFTYLILSIYLSGFLFLYISSFKVKKEIKITTFKETLNIIKEKNNRFVLAKELKETILCSFDTLINILGTIILCTIPSNIISTFSPSNCSHLLKGLIEFSIPSIELASMITNKKSIILTLSTILSFSSLSSIMQANLFINDVNLNSKQFITNRILITITTLLILSLFLFFL